MTDSVFEVCVARAVAKHGMFRGGSIGGRQAAFVYEWGQYMAETGDDPGTGRAFSRWANVSHGTAANRVAEFRDLFPEHETPAALARGRRLFAGKGRRSSSAALQTSG